MYSCVAFKVYFPCYKSATESLFRLKNGDECPGPSTAYVFRINILKLTRLSIYMMIRVGYLFINDRDMNIERIYVLLLAIRFLTIKMLSEVTGIHVGSVHVIVHDVLSTKFVPHIDVSASGSAAILLNRRTSIEVFVIE